MKKTLIEASGTLSRRAIKEEAGSIRGWVADVWRLGEKNLNGRIYPKELGERLVRENKSTLCYDGHESAMQSGLEYGNAVAVASRPRIENGCLTVDVGFIDKAFEERIEAIAERGVMIGVSSVGLGDVEGDGTVVAESYELIRYLDFVTCPAGEVWLRKEEEEKKEEAAAGEKATAISSLSAERKKAISDFYQRYTGEKR